jgi:hypothetical protein
MDYRFEKARTDLWKIIRDHESIGTVEFGQDKNSDNGRYANITWFCIYDEYAGRFAGPRATRLLIDTLKQEGYQGIYANNIVNQKIYRGIKLLFPKQQIPEFEKHMKLSIDF